MKGEVKYHFVHLYDTLTWRRKQVKNKPCLKKAYVLLFQKDTGLPCFGYTEFIQWLHSLNPHHPTFREIRLCLDLRGFSIDDCRLNIEEFPAIVNLQLSIIL